MRRAAVLLLLAACTGAKPEKIAVISVGEAVRPEDYLRGGYVTLLEFTRAGCGPCAELGPELDRLTEKYDRVLVRRVDILRTGTPAADQMSREFAGRDVPHVVVFRGDGGALGPVAADPSAIETAVQRALGLIP
ncbi:MAG TPA: thioredoxin family protein [Planctomycetota bacterium]|nr:thioredoxin family protein [Planctomycetota bacterium]